MGALSLPFIEADMPLDANNISKIVNYMATHTGTNVTVTIASILKGAK